MQEWTIAELRNKMASAQLTTRQLAEMYLGRIAMLDEGDDGINAVIELNPDALAIAENLDEERKTGKVRGPLHGIPALIRLAYAFEQATRVRVPPKFLRTADLSSKTL
jgi:amidase